MVANLHERGRKQCDKYWPEEDEDPLVVVDEFEVRPMETTYYSDYTRREFELVSKPSMKLNGSNRLLNMSSQSQLSRASIEMLNGK